MAKQAAMGFNNDTKKKLKAPDNSIVYSHKFYNLIPGDVAVAIEAALKKLELDFEEITTVVMNQMSGREEETPFIRYQTEDGIEIPMGTWRVDGLGDLRISTGRGASESISLTCMLDHKKFKPTWLKIVETTKELAFSNSIFRGKALQVFMPEDLLVPNKLDLSRDIKTIFNDPIEKDLQTCVMWPLINRKTAKEKGIRIRRGALLDGHYGCGKSLFLYNAAKAAHAAGWTVVNLAPGMISVASMIAPLLAPVVLIVEDVDAGMHGDRDALNPILNSLSSVGTKCVDDFVLLVSTNFLERIDPAALRPERIDAVIKVELPDTTSVKKLIKAFTNGRLQAGLPLDTAAAALAGCTPAIIAEVSQRCLINSEMNGGAPITEETICAYAEQMAFQKEQAVPQLRTNTTGDILAKTLHQVTDGQY